MFVSLLFSKQCDTNIVSQQIEISIKEQHCLLNNNDTNIVYQQIEISIKEQHCLLNSNDANNNAVPL
jgi:hypothetical protein